jgi:hypothetical protein
VNPSIYAAARHADGSVVLAGESGSAQLVAPSGLVTSLSSDTASTLFGCVSIAGVSWACGGSFEAGTQIVVSNLGVSPQTRLLQSGQPLLAVWGSDASHVWAVGYGGQILFFDGASWHSQVSGTSANLQGIFGLDSSRVYAVGESGAALFYDGVAWSALSPGVSSELRGVWATDATHVWVCGEDKILFFNGATWSTQYAAPKPAVLYAVAAQSATNLVAVGYDYFAGTYLVLRSTDGLTWQHRLVSVLDVAAAFYAAAPYNAGFLIAGTDGVTATGTF